jgi:hypothetical protein
MNVRRVATQNTYPLSGRRGRWAVDTGESLGQHGYGRAFESARIATMAVDEIGGGVRDGTAQLFARGEVIADADLAAHVCGRGGPTHLSTESRKGDRRESAREIL